MVEPMVAPCTCSLYLPWKSKCVFLGKLQECDNLLYKHVDHLSEQWVMLWFMFDYVDGRVHEK